MFPHVSRPCFLSPLKFPAIGFLVEDILTVREGNLQGTQAW